MSNYYSYDFPNIGYSKFDLMSDHMMSGGAVQDNTMYLLYIVLFLVVMYILYKMNHKCDSMLHKIGNQQRDIHMINKKYDKVAHDHDHDHNHNHDHSSSSGHSNIGGEDNANKKISINVNSNGNSGSDQNIPMSISPANIMRDYDYRALNDPLVAPRRRGDYNLPVLPLPSRGFPAPYKKVGVLIDKSTDNNDRYKILLLMGRNTYPSSTAYDYYVVENDKNSSLKFDIHKNRELQTGDIVHVHELNKEYKVFMDRILGYEYDPYLY
jgi:hypothetical protein